MPLKHQPSCLRTAAMHTIAKHFDMICFGNEPDVLGSLLNSDTYLTVEGPFSQMPATILEDMTEELKHVTHLRRHHLHMLIIPHLTSWSSQGIGDLQYALVLIAARCRNLKTMNLSYLRHMGPNTLLTLLPCFSKLVSLNLRMTLTVDQILIEIGKRCVNLVDLNLAMTPITDRGLVQLCVGQNGERQCQKLIRLIISETYITAVGATVALQSLPYLREFDFERIFEALEQVSNWNHELEVRLLTNAGIRLNSVAQLPPLTLRLTTLNSNVDVVSNEGLEAAANLCHDARSVVLSNAWIPSEALYKFMVMDHLTSLSLTNCDGLTLDFNEGVLPLLVVCGSTLQSLILTNFTSVQVSSIGQSCLQLQNLALSNIATYVFSGKPCPELFNQLRALELWAHPHNYIDANMILQLLLYSNNITNLLFTGCEVLSDRLLDEIYRVNPMKKLSHLTLDHCHAVTSGILYQFLDADNELTVLRIWSCLQITQQVNSMLCQRIIRENLDLYFEWFKYDN